MVKKEINQVIRDNSTNNSTDKKESVVNHFVTDINVNYLSSNKKESVELDINHAYSILTMKL